MTLYINEFGEFSPPDVFDPDLNRAKAYKCCIDVDMERMRKNAKREERLLADGKAVETAKCQHCHRTFRKKTPYQLYCSPRCQRDRYNENRRKEHAARSAARKPETAECLFCKAVFEKRRANQKYCSDKCQKAYNHRRKRDDRRRQ